MFFHEGKGTQAELLSREYGLRHISAGELLREEMRRDSPDSTIIRDVLNKGHIVPAEITVKLLKNEIGRQQCRHFVIDGTTPCYPPTTDFLTIHHHRISTERC